MKGDGIVLEVSRSVCNFTSVSIRSMYYVKVRVRVFCGVSLLPGALCGSRALYDECTT